MATRYWVGGTGTWSTSATANWSATSGGAGGASAPTSADDVVFDSLSNATSYTVTISGGVPCGSITTSGPATGTCSFTAAVASVSQVFPYGNLTFSATGFAFTNGLIFNFIAPSGSWAITTNGVSFPTLIYLGSSAGSTATWTLGSALAISGQCFIFSGTFDTAGYSVTTTQISRQTATVAQTTYLRSSTVTSNGSNPFVNLSNAGTTWNAGTSQINLSISALTFTGAGLTFYNVSFTSTALVAATITGANTFNNLTFAGRGSVGSGVVSVSANQTINDSLTFNAGASGIYRYRIYSSIAGSAITLSAATVSLTDVDFADITGAGTATWSGTRLGNIGGNSGITFPAAKTVYWSSTSTTQLSLTSSVLWSATSGGSTTLGSTTNFPLAQDTCIFDNNSCGTGGTPGLLINTSYSMGTLDFSAMTKAYTVVAYATYSNGQPFYVSGDIKLAASTTVTFTAGAFSIVGRSTQRLTTAGVSWPVPLILQNPGSTFQLQDNLTLSSTATITHNNGTVDANNQNITSAATFASNSGLTRALNLGTGTWTFSGGGSPWLVTSTGLTLTPSTSTLSFTSASAKTFAGGGLTYGTINQGGAGALTISGNNTFSNISNTVQPTTITFTAGSTTTVNSFNVNGTSGNLVTLNSSSAGTQFNLVYA